MGQKHFCTCPDHECKLNPVNHEQGCDLCIKKCLKKEEIPSCFFIAVAGSIDGVKDFSYDGFARAVEKKNRRCGSGEDVLYGMD